MLLGAFAVNSYMQQLEYMPYVIKKKGTKYQVLSTETHEVCLESKSKAKADRGLDILKGIERNWDRQPDGTYTRTVNGKKATLRLVGSN